MILEEQLPRIIYVFEFLRYEGAGATGYRLAGAAFAGARDEHPAHCCDLNSFSARSQALPWSTHRSAKSRQWHA